MADPQCFLTRHWCRVGHAGFRPDATEPAPVSPDSLADLAETAAAGAAERLRDAVGGELRVVQTKSSGTDLVTETDRAVESQIMAVLAEARPDDAFLGEEHGSRPGTSGVTWIVDPIDGTTNFYYGLAGFNISIAAAVDDVVVAGVVTDPLRGETFRATRGGGATCNGVPLKPEPPDNLAGALIGTGFSYVAERRRDQARVLAHLAGRIRDVRRLGAAALDLCYVAAGRLDGYYESGLHIWDLAAGGLIATEAGCRLGGLDGAGADSRLVIAAHPDVFDEFVATLEEAAADGLAVEDPSAPPAREFGRLVV